MNQKQENITTMFEATLQFLDNNSTIWSSTPAFATAVTDARNGVQAIRDASDIQELGRTVATAQKQQARDDLEDKTIEMADRLAALAAKTGDVGLGEQVQMTRSTLDQLQDDDLVQTAQRVRDIANANLTDLAPYGVTAGTVTALSDAITTFSGLKTAPRSKAADRKAQTETLPQLIADVRSIFRNQLDKLMTPFKRTEPEFYAGYFAARVIVDRAPTRATATAPPAPSGQPTPPAPQPV
jgi:hypothetical protein